jgi:hypothetical protein
VPNPGMKTCPECAEEIKLEARVCRFCGTTFSLVEVGYCVHCHRVTATSDLGVCVVCNSRLIDVHLESVEASGPKVEAVEKAERSGLAPVAAVTGPVMPVADRGAAPGDEEPDTAENVLADSGAEIEAEAEEAEEAKEAEEKAEPEGEEAPAEPAPTRPPFTPVSVLPAPEKTPEPEGVRLESSASEEPGEASPEQAEPELPSPPPAPGPPTGVISWARRGSTFEPVTKPEEPVAPAGEPEAEKPAPVEEPPQVEEKPAQPVVPSSDVAERLAAFGRRTPPSAVQPPAGSPTVPPPSPPAATPSAPTTPRTPEREEGASQAAAVHVKTEAHPEAAKEVAESEKAPEKGVVERAGERLGIVPSLTHRIAHPLYQLAAVVVVVIWLVELYWNHSLKGTSQAGSKTLAHLAVATYGSGGTLLIGAQIGIVAILCGLLAPTRVLPRGWFRRRGVAKEFTRDLKAQLGVKMIFQRKWYLERMILAFVIWAIALAYFVWGIAQKTSVNLQVGGYITTAAILVGFACSAVLMMRRTPVVSVDENGKIRG